MTTPPSSGHTPQGTGPAPRFFESIRNLGIVRTDNRWIGGVAGGIARRFGIDPAIVRGIFAVSIVLGGLGLWVYAIAWAFLPEEIDARIHAQELLAGRFDIAIIGAAAMFVAGWLSPSTWWGWAVPVWSVIQAVVLVAAVVIVVYLIATRRPSSPAPPRPTAPPTPPTPPTPPAASWSGGYSATGTAAPAPASPSSAPPSHESGAPFTPSAESVESVPSSSPGAAMTEETDPPTDVMPNQTPPEDVTALLPESDVTTPLATATHEGPDTVTAPITSLGADDPLPQGPPPYRPPMESRYAPPPTPMPTQLPVEKARVLGPGAATVAVVTAMTLFTAAAIMIVNRVADWAIPVGATSIAAFVVYAGVGLIVTGVRGRRSGVLGFLAIVAIILGIPAAWTSQMNLGVGPWGDYTARPVTVAAATDGLAVGIGHAVLDLTDLPTPTKPITVPVEFGIGQVEVIVPADLPTDIDVTLGAGQVDFYPASSDSQKVTQSTGNRSLITNDPRTFEFQTQAAANAEPVVTVTVDANIGQVIVRESN